MRKIILTRVSIEQAKFSRIAKTSNKILFLRLYRTVLDVMLFSLTWVMLVNLKK